MKITKQHGLNILVGAIALTVFFTLGYLVANKSEKTDADTPTAPTNSDMDLAFGNPKSSAHQSGMNGTASSSLSGLVAGLEKKVAANPGNIDQQLLLAQTYKELDNRDKSIKLLSALNKSAPNNAQVKIIFATILMTSADKQELKEASKLFDEAIKLNPEVANMARLYQGEIKVKLGKSTK